MVRWIALWAVLADWPVNVLADPQLPEAARKTWTRHGATLGMNPLLAAAVGGFGRPPQFWAAMVQEMLRNKVAPVDGTNRNGATALVLAAQFGNLEAVRVLLDAGAAVDAADDQGATALLGATFGGHSSTVEALLAAGASPPAHFSLAGVARAEGHDALAALLDASNQDKGFEDSQAELEGGPLHIEPITCGLDAGLAARLDAARCYLAGCGRGAAMPSVDAYSAICQAGTPCIYTPVGTMVTGITSMLVDKGTPSWRLHAQRDRHLDAAGRKVSLMWASECPDGEDAWACLFGRGEAADARADQCACEDGKGEAPSPRDLQVAILGAIVLAGNRTSSHLQSGPAAPPLGETYAREAEAEGIEDGGIAVSVHVRAGDSCDVATRSHTAHTWAYWPFEWAGAKGTNWQSVRRFCIHPSVHLATLRGVMATRRVRSVLLATDSAEAAALFKSELSSEGVELHVASFDRSALAVTDEHLKVRQHRHHAPFFLSRTYPPPPPPPAAPHASRTVLSRGTMLIGACNPMFCPIFN